MDLTLWFELTEALDHRTDPDFLEVDDGSLMGAMCCEIETTALDNFPSLFIVQLGISDRGVELLWGFRDATLRLRTVWLTEEQSHPPCQSCGCHHDPTLACPEEPIEELVATPGQLITAVMAKIDEVLENYADAYAEQPVENADITQLLEQLREKWYQACSTARTEYLHYYEPLLGWELSYEITDGKHTVTWTEARNKAVVEAIKLSAYQKDGSWRIDFHYDELGLLQTYEPYQFVDQVGQTPALIVRCHCCPDAPMVKPDVFPLRTALPRIWEDIRIILQARRDKLS